MQLNIFIHHNNVAVKEARALFILTRPFYLNNKWVDCDSQKEKYGLESAVFQLVETIEKAQIVLLPFSINSYFLENKQHELEHLNMLCQQLQINVYGYIVDDFGITFPEFSNIFYFRASGFKSQLSKQNKGFPVILSDHFQLRYKQETVITRCKSDLPIIGFCGHATFSIFKLIKEKLIFVRENLKRLLNKPFRKDWEPLFASAYERATIMKLLEQSSLVSTNFIYRNLYRAGAKTEQELENSTQAYFNNIYTSDYVLCIRGAGNFSVRFYETLMMGRIPIFVNTDCLLPFEDSINWKKHVVWVEWSERNKIAEIIYDFHNKMSDTEFKNLQLENRKLWKETLSVKGMLEIIVNDI